MPTSCFTNLLRWWEVERGCSSLGHRRIQEWRSVCGAESGVGPGAQAGAGAGAIAAAAAGEGAGAGAG